MVTTVMSTDAGSLPAASTSLEMFVVEQPAQRSAANRNNLFILLVFQFVASAEPVDCRVWRVETVWCHRTSFHHLLLPWRSQRRHHLETRGGRLRLSQDKLQQ